MILSQDVFIFSKDEDQYEYCSASYRISRSHSFGHPGQPPGHVAKSHCLVCPGCQRVWAKLVLDQEPFLVWPVAQFCSDCQITTTWLPVPGSLLVEEGFGVIDRELLWALPAPLLRREFDLHLRAYSKW